MIASLKLILRIMRLKVMIFVVDDYKLETDIEDHENEVIIL